MLSRRSQQQEKQQQEQSSWTRRNETFQSTSTTNNPPPSPPPLQVKAMKRKRLFNTPIWSTVKLKPKKLLRLCNFTGSDSLYHNMFTFVKAAVGLVTTLFLLFNWFVAPASANIMPMSNKVKIDVHKQQELLAIEREKCMLLAERTPNGTYQLGAS